jgi:hypothetical protein
VATLVTLRCEECGAVSVNGAEGWRSYLAFDPREDEHPVTVSYCPDCARREFGAARRSARTES